MKPKSQGVYELQLSKGLSKIENAQLTVSVKDGEGNTRRIERTLSVE